MWRAAAASGWGIRSGNRTAFFAFRSSAPAIPPGSSAQIVGYGYNPNGTADTRRSQRVRINGYAKEINGAEHPGELKVERGKPRREL